MANRPITLAAKSQNASVGLCKNCETDTDRIATLAELVTDQWCWRGEEADRMKAMEQRLEKLELVIEDNGAGSYLMEVPK